MTHILVHSQLASEKGKLKDCNDAGKNLRGKIILIGIHWNLLQLGTQHNMLLQQAECTFQTCLRLIEYRGACSFKSRKVKTDHSKDDDNEDAAKFSEIHLSVPAGRCFGARVPVLLHPPGFCSG